MGLGAAFAGWLLGRFGYVPNAVQSASSIHGILLLTSLIPAAGCLLVAAVFWFYGLTEELCHTMREDLAARRDRAG
jgi:GPH family glycoside/pentoside/hexuronide:cation symporter